MCFYSIEGFLRILVPKITLYWNPRDDRSKKLLLDELLFRVFKRSGIQYTDRQQ